MTDTPTTQAPTAYRAKHKPEIAAVQWTGDNDDDVADLLAQVPYLRSRIVVGQGGQGRRDVLLEQSARPTRYVRATWWIVVDATGMDVTIYTDPAFHRAFADVAEDAWWWAPTSFGDVWTLPADQQHHLLGPETFRWSHVDDAGDLIAWIGERGGTAGQEPFEGAAHLVRFIAADGTGHLAEPGDTITWDGERFAVRPDLGDSPVEGN
jgi:hypothetical protein